ncbi:MAG: hypothetical protein AB1439_06905 [candidate division FCPU426 bacterium]
MRRALLTASLIVLLAGNVLADVPRTVNYQGRLTDLNGNPMANGTYAVTTTIYDSLSGGSSLWSDNYSVQTTNGYFSLILGSNAARPLNLDFTQQYYIGIAVSPDAEMSPRQPLTSVPYALNVARGAATESWSGFTDMQIISNTNEVTIIDVPFTLKDSADIFISSKSIVNPYETDIVVSTRIYIDSTLVDESNVTYFISGAPPFSMTNMGIYSDLAAGNHHAYFRVKFETGTVFDKRIFKNRLCIIAHYR